MDYELDKIVSQLQWGANGEFSAMLKPPQCERLVEELCANASMRKQLDVLLPALREIRDGICVNHTCVEIASKALADAACPLPHPEQQTIS